MALIESQYIRNDGNYDKELKEEFSRSVQVANEEDIADLYDLDKLNAVDFEDTLQGCTLPDID